MIIYNYHPTTLEFLGQSEADMSPLEPGVYLIPAHATTKVPISGEAGKVRKFVNDKWVLESVSVETKPKDPAYVPSLAELKQKKSVAIRDAADAYLEVLAVEYGVFEKLTWDQQAVEASGLLKDPLGSAPLLHSIAQARGMDVLVLAQRVVDNRTQWLMLSGTVVGKRLAYQDKLDAAITAEEVSAINPVFC